MSKASFWLESFPYKLACAPVFSPPCFRRRRAAPRRVAGDSRPAADPVPAPSPTPNPLRSAGLSGCPVVVPSPRFVSFPRLLADLPRFTGPSSYPISRYPSLVLCQCQCHSVSVWHPARGELRDEEVRTASGRDRRTRGPDGWRRDEDGRATSGTDGRVSRTDGGRSATGIHGALNRLPCRPKNPFLGPAVPADTFPDAEVPVEHAKMTALKRRSLLARVVFSHFGHPNGGFCT